MTFRLADAVFWAAAACCAVGHIAILHSVVGAPAGPGGDRSAVRRRVVEVVWAVVPGVALAVVLLFTWRAMHRHVHVTHGAPASVASATR